MNELADLLPPFIQHPGQLAFAFAAVVLAYAVFTLVGFGSALMAGGPLAAVMPVARVIPTLALLDFAGASLRGWRARKEVAWHEFVRLFPGMLAGQALGVFVLAKLPPALMAAAMGLFVCSQGLKGLLKRERGPTPPRWPAVQGMIGGVLGGLFGSGGFIYAAYLERRLESRTAFRATQAVLIALSTAWRIVLCLSVGLLDAAVAGAALCFLPAMALGVFLGHRVDLRMSREKLFLLLNTLLVLSGLNLMARYVL